MDYVEVTSKAQVPDAMHWVILTFDSVRIEGDERSRTNPGHGYPAHMLAFCHYLAYRDRDKWLAEVERRATADLRSSVAKPGWVAFEAGRPVRLTVSVSVDIK